MMLAFALFFSVGYMLCSTLEWVFHKYFMHNEERDALPGKVLNGINRRHVIHHNVTNPDMTVRPSEDKYRQQQLHEYMWLEQYAGLYFLWPPTIAMWIGGTVGGPVLNYILGALLSPWMEYDVSGWTAMAAGFLLTTWVTVIWNWLHPQLHHARGLSLSEGLDIIPRWEWMKSSFLYNYLWRHHVLHHVLVGENAGNFNVTLPGADWWFGTLHTECAGYQLDVDHKRIHKMKK